MLARECKSLNELDGDLEGYDCDWCRNKGVIYAVKDGCVVAQECNCMMVRRNRLRVQKSGLDKLLEQNTFSTYLTVEGWQKRVKAMAEEYVENFGDSYNHRQDWFFYGGQVGAGKTHICTAIAGGLMSKGFGVKYMQWREEATKLKSIINDDEYGFAVKMLKSVDVLYMDDFFKTNVDRDGKKQQPTSGDINLAFEIINARYNQGYVTIISSERTIDEIITVDEAVGSRIAQMAKRYTVNLVGDINKNYRLKGV